MGHHCHLGRWLWGAATPKVEAKAAILVNSERPPQAAMSGWGVEDEGWRMKERGWRKKGWRMKEGVDLYDGDTGTPWPSDHVTETEPEVKGIEENGELTS